MTDHVFRYRDVASGKFISVEDDPDLKPEMGKDPDLDLIEAQVLSTLAEIAADPVLAAKSSASVRMLLGLVEKLRRDVESDEGGVVHPRQGISPRGVDPAGK